MVMEVVLVDLDNNVLGVEEKIVAHKKRLLHRAFSLYIYNGKKILLQQRAFDKYHSGGKWANACCSHPVLNMEIEDCIMLRAREELGVVISKPTKLFDFIYYSEYEEGFSEYEFDDVFIVEYDGDVKFDTKEVNDVRWITVDELKNELICDPSKFSTWFLISVPRVIGYLENKI